jgi:tyrosyl-tRNA synthetase
MQGWLGLKNRISMATSQQKTDFLAELHWRGLLQDHTPQVADYLAQPGGGVGYIGFDPTADSLHVGNLATAMLLVRFRLAGHQPIALVGGATGMIGDPSGKSEERKLLDLEALRHNEACVSAQLQVQIERAVAEVGGSDGPKLQVVNNYDWFQDFSFIEFLRKVGKHLTVNYMTSKESVQKRLETGISFTEFSYQLLQAYDFRHLYQHHNCKLQLGGSDQWGNITSGIELIRRMDGHEAHGIVGPLVTKADGTKFGKSEQGNIWLDAARTSPYRFYQFWLNTADDDLARMLRVFSLKTQSEIEALEAAHASAPHQRQAQRALAEELTARVHSPEALQQAQQATDILFGAAPAEALHSLSPPLILDVFDGVPQAQLSRSQLEAGYPVLDLLADAGLSKSKGEARRSIQAGGIRINRLKVESAEAVIQTESLLAGQFLLLQEGKKKYHLAIFG